MAQNKGLTKLPKSIAEISVWLLYSFFAFSSKL